MEEVSRALARLDCEVGPRGVADEERVAGQHDALVDDERTVLGAVARCVDDAHRDGAGVHHPVVLERVERVPGRRERMDRRRHVVLEREPAVAGHVVGVRMRLEDAHDLHALAPRVLEVLLDRERGIDDERLARREIADEV